MKFKNIVGSQKNNNFLIVGAGSTILKYQDQIKKFIEENETLTIGINNMTDFIIPDYHIWTNNGRLRNYGKSINPSSKLILGSSIKKENIPSHIKDYIKVNYIDKEGMKIGYKEGKIYGFFRTAGCLAIMIAHLLGAKNIYIVGMDGYTLHGKEGTISKSQHLYGKGMTDGNSWEICKEKDGLVYSALKRLDKYGIRFSILTPTIFKKFENEEFKSNS